MSEIDWQAGAPYRTRAPGVDAPAPVTDRFAVGDIVYWLYPNSPPMRVTAVGDKISCWWMSTNNVLQDHDFKRENLYHSFCRHCGSKDLEGRHHDWCMHAPPEPR